MESTKETASNNIPEQPMEGEPLSAEQQTALFNEFKARAEQIKQQEGPIFDGKRNEVDMLIEKAMSNKDDGSEEYKDPRASDQKQQPAKPVTGFKKAKLALTMMLAGLGLVGNATGTEGGKNEDPVKGKASIENRDLSKAVKTNVAPSEKEGYKPLGTKDGKTYYVQESSELEKAKAGGKRDEAKTISYITQELQKGISPEALIKAGHGSATVINELAKTHYKEKIVYTEPEKVEVKQTEESDGPKFSKMSSRYYGPNKHALADIWTEVRDSKDKSDGGMLDTGEELRKIQLIDEMGNNDGAPFVLAKGELQKLTGGDEAFDISAEELRTIRDTALNKGKNNTYTLTGEEIAQGGINK